MVKAIYDKPTANIILNGKNLKTFPLRSGIKQRCTLSSLLFNVVLEVLSTPIREEKEIKWIQIRKEVKFADDLILYIENLKDSMKKILELTSEFSKVAGYKNNTQKSFVFHILIMKNNKEKLRNQSHSPLPQKKIKYLWINLPKKMKELYTDNYKTLMKKNQRWHKHVPG